MKSKVIPSVTIEPNVKARKESKALAACVLGARNLDTTHENALRTRTINNRKSKKNICKAFPNLDQQEVWMPLNVMEGEYFVSTSGSFSKLKRLKIQRRRARRFRSKQDV